jgi:hypothetical protein
MATAKFRNSMSFLSLREQGIKWCNVRENDKNKHCAYFYANKQDLDNHENIVSHCYCTEDAVAALQDDKKDEVYFCECSQDNGASWVPLLCIGNGEVTGTKGTSVLTIEL